MCVDATRKFAEEKRDLRNRTMPDTLLDTSAWSESLLDSFHHLYPEIKSINTSLVRKGISIVFISIQKNRKLHIKELNEKLFRETPLKAVKFIIYVEHTVDANDIADVVWRWSNNLDPRRDSYIIPAIDENGISHIGFDGTRKTKEFDNFDREWPNIICMDEATIQKIDEKWNQLPLGKFIPSPSLKYRKQLYKGGAVAAE
jgi:4-hydroxy-3-polyprenylbenzoate decarboxylase